MIQYVVELNDGNYYGEDMYGNRERVGLTMAYFMDDEKQAQIIMEEAGKYFKQAARIVKVTLDVEPLTEFK